MNKLYKIYGLIIESEFEIEEAIAIDNAAYLMDEAVDVYIKNGKMPDAAKEIVKDKQDNEFFLSYTSSAAILGIADIAKYYVDANQIIVEPVEGASLSEIKCYILGSSLGFCMSLKNMIAIHGGAVAKNGKGVIVTGVSGAGKSTVCNSLRENGYLFISDDVCPISESANGEGMHIDLAYPQQKLCRDAAIRMGYDLSELIYINEDRDKFAIRLKDGFLPEGEDFKYLFEIVFSDDDELHFNKVQGHEKLFTVIRNIYRGESSLGMWGMPPTAMKECAKIAQTTEIYQIARPAGKVTLDEIVKRIEEIVQS